MNKTQSITLFAAIITSVLVVSSAQAAVKDPRVCRYGPARKADCARDAASLAARRYLQKVTGQQMLWQGPMTCTSAGTILRWRCSFNAYNTPQLPDQGHVLVIFRATSNGWRVTSQVVG